LGSCAVGVRDDPDYVVSCGCQVPDLTRTGELAAGMQDIALIPATKR